MTLLGVAGVFAYNALFFTGLKIVTASRSALIIANTPMAIALGAALFLGAALALSRRSATEIPRRS